MEVIYYQMFIASSLLIFNYFAKDRLIWACGAWSVFSLVNLNYPPLILIQLGVVWGTFVLLRARDNRKKEMDSLKKELSNLTEQQQEYVRNTPPEKRTVLEGVQHFDHLIRSVISARDRVIILSGWISSNVLDPKFMKIIEERLQQGVSIYIGYGWAGSDGKHEESKASRSARTSLVELSNKYPGKLRIVKFPNHEKLLIVDGKQVVFGSANWLSNRYYKNSERSIVLDDPHLASAESNRALKLFER